MQQTRALWHIDDTKSEIKQADLMRAPESVIVESAFSLISLGTELLIAHGFVPSEMYADMEVPHMAGNFEKPLKYGYSLTGKLRESGAHVHLMHPHQDICSIPPSHGFEIPVNIPLKRATLASNLETALNAVWDARVLPGEKAVVVGFGMIGSLVSRVASGIPACAVEVVDTDPGRLQYADEFGFSVLEDANESIGTFDVAFHCSGTGAGLQQAIDLVGMEGRIVELSWYGTHTINISLGGAFHNLRKRIISSQVGSIPPDMASRWDFTRRKKAVFELLQDEVYDPHITHVISLEEAAGLFNTWRHKRPEGLGYCISYLLGA